MRAEARGEEGRAKGANGTRRGLREETMLERRRRRGGATNPQSPSNINSPVFALLSASSEPVLTVLMLGSTMGVPNSGVPHFEQNERSKGLPESVFLSAKVLRLRAPLVMASC